MTRVLIVDDEEMVRITIRQMLEKVGLQVDVANNGETGLERQRADPADLLITDIIMPDMDGIEMIIEFRKEFPKTKIVAVSGGGRLGNQDFLKVAKQIGADAVLPKPFKRSELLEAITRALKPKQEA